MTTVTIGTGTSSYDASALGGGDIINVTSGTRGSLTILNATGAAGNPILIRNNGGQVIINAGDPALTLNNCQYVELSGQGHARMYGFKLTNFSNTGLMCKNQTEYAEVHHLEIGPESGAGAAGIRWHTLKSEADPFTVHDIYIHHLYIHDCQNEAMYINSHSLQDNPAGPMDGVEIAWNIIDGMGYDGIQVRQADDVSVHHNRVMDVGDNVAGTGQAGAAFIVGNELGNARFWRNHATDCVRGFYGLSFEAGIEIDHNLIENMNTIDVKPGRGIWLSTDGNGIEIEWNTILDCDNVGIDTKAGDGGGTIRNNIVAGCPTNIDSDFATITNNSTGTIAAQNFRASDELRHLTATSPAVGAASDGSDCGWLDYN